MTHFTALPLGLALALTAVPATAQTPPPPPPPEANSRAAPYVMAAGQSDLFEIESSQLALQKSRTPAIRQYADMLIKHHRQTTTATLAAARKAGMTPPPPVPNPGARASIGELQSASAADFDRIYLAQQVPAHRAALALHKSYGAGGDQAALRTSARKAVPIVQQHLTAAERMQRSR